MAKSKTPHVNIYFHILLPSLVVFVVILLAKPATKKREDGNLVAKGQGKNF